MMISEAFSRIDTLLESHKHIHINFIQCWSLFSWEKQICIRRELMRSWKQRKKITKGDERWEREYRHSEYLEFLLCNKDNRILFCFEPWKVQRIWKFRDYNEGSRVWRFIRTQSGHSFFLSLWQQGIFKSGRISGRISGGMSLMQHHWWWQTMSRFIGDAVTLDVYQFPLTMMMFSLLKQFRASSLVEYNEIVSSSFQLSHLDQSMAKIKRREDAKENASSKKYDIHSFWFESSSSRFAILSLHFKPEPPSDPV